METTRIGEQYYKITNRRNDSDPTHIKVSAWYDKGDNYYGGKQRGFYASIYPIIRENKEGYAVERTMLEYPRYNTMLTDAKRFSQKAANEIFDKFQHNGLMKENIDKICRSHGWVCTFSDNLSKKTTSTVKRELLSQAKDTAKESQNTITQKENATVSKEPAR